MRRLHFRHVRKSLLQDGQRPQPQAVLRRRTKTWRSLSYPNQEKTLGTRRIGEKAWAKASVCPLVPAVGHRPMPIWVAPWKMHARCNSHPRKRVREIHQLEPPSKPPQLSPCRVFVRPGESIRLWSAVSDAAKLKGLTVVLEAGHAGTCYIIRNSLGRPVTKHHVTMGVRQGSVEGPLCFILLCALSITQAQKNRPQHQRVIAVVPRRNTVSSHFGVKQFEPPQLLSTLGVRWSLKEARTQRRR